MSDASHDPAEASLSDRRHDRFETRARALVYARLGLMTIILAVLVFPAWHRRLNMPMPQAAYWYLGALVYHVASFLWLGRRRARHAIFVSLCLDVLAVLYLIVASGGIKSPLMPTQLVLTLLFALLYPTPLALLPPLLTLPVIAKVDQILGIQTLPGDLLLMLWYVALNTTVVYVTVYLESRERASFDEVLRLQREQRRSALERQRTRIAREIHDGVGAALSGVLLQAEYLMAQAEEDALRRELDELRGSAAEGMDELRRAVSMLHHEFQLSSAIPDYVDSFVSRHRLEADVVVEGVEQEVEPDRQLVLFRVLQEALANVARHAEATSVKVTLSFAEETVGLAVEDDGKGFDPGDRVVGHYGLRNMRDRALKADGTLEIRSAPGEGAAIVVSLPIR